MNLASLGTNKNGLGKRVNAYRSPNHSDVRGIVMANRKATCKHGHPRTTENTRYRANGTTDCKVCHRERQRDRNYERGTQARSCSLFCREGHRKTPENRRPGRSDCAICHRDKQVARYRERPDEHRAKVRAYHHAHRAEQSASEAAWRDANRDHVRAYFRFQYAIRSVGVTTRAKHQLREWLRADPCAYCGGPTGGGVDHIDPVIHGGTNTAENLTAACRRCNQEKHDTTLLLFLARRRAA